MSLDQILKSDYYREEVLRLTLANPGGHIAICGPEGRGKSELLRNVLKQPQLNDYCCLMLSGNNAYKERSFFPLQQFVEKKDKTFNRGIRALKESIALIPYVGKTVKAFIEDYDFKKHKERHVIEELEPFKEHIDFSIHLIGLLRKYEKLIICCDDLEDFDNETISYLNLVQEGLVQLEIHDKITLITCSSDGRKIFNWGHGVYKNIELPAFLQNDIKDIIFTLSGQALSNTEIEFIFSATGGNLQLLKIAAEYVKEAGGNLTSVQNNFLERLIALRLRGFTEHYEHLTQLLTAIGRGNSSTTYELYCLLENTNEVKDTIKMAIAADLLKSDHHYVYFAHPLIADYAASLPVPKRVFFEKLAGCLQKLAPSEYLRRATILKLAEKNVDAETMMALAGISAFRGGALGEGLRIVSQLRTISNNIELVETLEIFATCFELNATGNIENTLLELEKIPNLLPREIMAEKVYLKADTLARRISDEAKQDALKLILAWEDIKSEESEIWYRLMQTKLIIAAELGLHDLSLNAETEIIKHYSSRLNFDPNAKSILDRLNIFSEVMYSPEVANRKMVPTEKRLTSQLLQNNYHRIFDLYLSRVNLSGNCLIVNELSLAIEYAQNAILLVSEFPELKFPCPEAAFNNLYLSALWKNESDVEFIYTKFRELYQSAAIEENRLLVDINYAGLCLIAGQLEEALVVLQNCVYIPEIEDDNAFYSYYYFSNYIILLSLLGRAEEASHIIDKLSTVHGKVSKHLSRYYEQHFKLVKDVVETKHFTSYMQIVQYVDSAMPVYLGKVWERFKTLYLFTDIQIWNLY